MSQPDLCRLTATDMAKAIRARQLSPVELVDALLSRIRQLNPAIKLYPARVNPQYSLDIFTMTSQFRTILEHSLSIPLVRWVTARGAYRECHGDRRRCPERPQPCIQLRETSSCASK